LGIHRRKQE